MVDPETAGWAYSRAAGARAAAGRRRARSTPDRTRCWCCRCPASATVTCGGRAGRAGRPAVRLERADRLRLPAGRLGRDGVQCGRRPVRAAGARARGGCRSGWAGRRGAGRAARRRRVLPAGQQLLHPGGVRGRPADRLRGAHPGRQLVVLPAAQARRGPARGVGAGGDLLLRGRAGGGRLRATSGCTAPERPIDVLAEVRTGDVVLVPHGWHGPSMAAPGYDLYYLNVMAGPARAGLADQRRPGARLGPRRPGPTRRSTRGCRSGGTPMRLTVGAGPRAVPRRPAHRAGRGRPPAVRRLLRHLRARQRRRRRPGAAAGRAASAPGALPLLPGPQRAGHGARGRRLRPDAQPAVHLACTASVGPGATNMLTGAALATVNRLPVLLLPSDVFATRVSSPVLQELEVAGRLRRHRSTTRSARCPGSSTGSGGPSSCRPRCSARCGCSPTRPRPARSPSRCRRTCRPRRTTGRRSCSPSGCGTSPGRCRSRPRWPARSR